MKQDAVMTRFFTAIIMGDLPAVTEIMPEHPAWRSWVSPGGYPPLHMAVMNSHQDMAVHFVEQGADINQVACGATAAKLADNKGMLEKLVEAAGRKDQIRAAAIESCGEQMHKGLDGAVQVPRRLSLIRRNSPKI
jgi:hypothetical protein